MHPLSIHTVWLASLLCALAAAAFAAIGADYPAKPVKIITQGAAGSGPDVLARIVADHLARRWGQPALIVNHPGGGGIAAARAAAMAEPNGYTLYLPTITTFVILPELHDNLGFEIDRQFAPIGLVAETPMMIAVGPALGVSSLAELIARARAQPGTIFYAANNRGSLPHLTGELLRRRTEIELNFVPYPGVNAGLQDLMGGRIAMIVESVGALSGAVKTGAVKALAVAAAQRLPNLPDVPTVSETTPGFVAVGWFVLAAPATVPPNIIQRLNQDLNAVLQQEALRHRFEELGAFVRPMSPQQTVEFIRAEQQAWRPIVRQVELKVK